MHGGDGWTIQYPGGDHSHAYPGGKVRNHFQSTQSTTKTTITIIIGTIATVVLAADDATVVGAADDFLLPQAVGCLAVGINGLCGEKVCTECGEVRYGF